MQVAVDLVEPAFGPGAPVRLDDAALALEYAAVVHERRWQVEG